MAIRALYCVPLLIAVCLMEVATARDAKSYKVAAPEFELRVPIHAGSLGDLVKWMGVVSKAETWPELADALSAPSDRSRNASLVVDGDKRSVCTSLISVPKEQGESSPRNLPLLPDERELLAAVEKLAVKKTGYADVTAIDVKVSEFVSPTAPHLHRRVSIQFVVHLGRDNKEAESAFICFPAHGGEESVGLGASSLRLAVADLEMHAAGKILESTMRHISTSGGRK